MKTLTDAVFMLRQLIFTFFFFFLARRHANVAISGQKLVVLTFEIGNKGSRIFGNWVYILHIKFCANYEIFQNATYYS